MPARGGFELKDFVSLIALAISVISAYVTLFMRGALRGRLGPILLIQQYADSGHLWIKPALALINTGATTVVVYAISGTLTNTANDHNEALVWVENLTSVFVESPDEKTGVGYSFRKFSRKLFCDKDRRSG